MKGGPFKKQNTNLMSFVKAKEVSFFDWEKHPRDRNRFFCPCAKNEVENCFQIKRCLDFTSIEAENLATVGGTSRVWTPDQG